MEKCKIIRPVDVTDARLTSSTVAEPDAGDPSLWNAATAYTAGQRVTYLATHGIYQRVTPGTTATSPDLDETNWVYVQPTNRWAMLDASNSTQSTTTAETLVVVLTPGALIDSMAFDNVIADEVQVQVAGTAYDETIRLRVRTVVGWFSWFYEQFRQRKAAAFFNMPLKRDAAITVTFRRVGGGIKVGTLVMGRSKALGYTEKGLSLGILDFTTKDLDTWGNITVTERGYSKRMKPDVFVDNVYLDDINDTLSAYRGKPLVYVAAGNAYASMIIFGFYRSFELLVAYDTHSWLNLDIEGISQ